MKQGIVLICLGLTLSFFCVSWAQQELTVSCNLSGPLQTIEKKEVVLVFSDDMVALGGSRDAAEIVALRPGLAGEWIWRGTATLALRPSGRFAFATRYRVTVKAGSRSLNGRVLGQEANWEFSTPLAVPLKIAFSDITVFPVSQGKIFSERPPQTDFLLIFDQPVSADRLRRSLNVREKGSAKKIKVELWQKSDTQVGVHFSSVWKVGEQYECTIRRGFRGEEGDLALDKEFTFSFSTLPRLEYLGSSRLTIRPDDRMIVLPFNRPLGSRSKGAIQVFPKKVKIQGPVPEVEVLTTRWDRLELVLSGPLRPNQEYRLRLDKSLESALGDCLEKDVDIVLECRPAPPAAYAERADSGIDLHVRGVSTLDLSVFKIKKSALGSLFFNDGKFPAADIASIADPVLRRTVCPEGEEPQKVNVPLDGGPGIFGLVLEKIFPFRNDLNLSIPAKEMPAPGMQLFHVHNVDFLVRVFKSTALFWAYDNKSGNPLAGARIFLTHPEEYIPLGATDERGLLLIDRELKDKDIILVENGETEDLAFCRLADLDREEKSSEYGIDVFTDRGIYLPGEEVHVAGIVKRWRGGAIGSPGLDKVYLLIADEKKKTVLKKTVELDPYGGFQVGCLCSAEWMKGFYYVDVSTLAWPDDEEKIDDFRWNEAEGHSAFMLDYFQADRFRVDISGVKDCYKRGEPFQGLIQGQYLAGNPMVREKLKWNLRVDSVASWLPSTEKKWSDYEFWLDPYFRSVSADVENEVRLDEEGTHRPALDWERLGDLNYAAQCCLMVTVETKEGKEVEAFKWPIYIPGDRIVGIKIPPFVRAGEVQADLVLLDSSPREVAGRIDVYIYRRVSEKSSIEPQLESEFKDVKLDKTRSFSFRIEKEGDYFIRCDAKDAEGKVLSSSAEFHVGRFAWDERKRKRPEITTDKRSYQIGETARIRILSPGRGKVLITVEQGKVLDVFVVDAAQAADFALPIRREYFQRIWIQAAVLDGTGGIAVVEEEVEVASDEKKLRVELSCADKEIRPAAHSAIRLIVRNERGQGRKARAFVYAVDEGVLQMNSYSTPRPFEYFYYGFSSWFFAKGQYFISWDNALIDVLNRGLGNLNEMAVAGFVSDEEGHPLSGVVAILNNKRAIVTDQRGYFLLTAVSLRSYEGLNLVFRKKGYLRESRFVNWDIRKPFNSIRVVMNRSDRPNKPEKPAVGFKRSLFDSRECTIRGAATDEEGNTLPGVSVTLYKTGDPDLVVETTTDANGEYCLRHIPPGKYTLYFSLIGFKTVSLRLDVSSPLEGVNGMLEVATIAEEVTVIGSSPSVLYGEGSKDRVALAANEWKNSVRKDFRRLLFFEAVETDAAGEALIPFQASDQISTFRVMAVAYDDDSFGSAETALLVSKKLLLDEAMPEFARQGDQFRAGTLVSNRTQESLDVAVSVRSDTLAVSGPTDLKLSLAPRANDLASFEFAAPQIGESKVTFYAQSKADKDALQKILPVTDRLSFESLLDFSTGAEIVKKVQPLDGVDKQTLKIKVAPSILKPAVKVAEKLAFYPYECLEQRASKVMPYLILDEDFVEKLRLSLDQKQIREAIQGFIAVVPEFIVSDGGLAYYRGSDWSSEYLTLYVLWSLRLAQKKNYTVQAGLVDKLNEYLGRRSLKNDRLAFYQYLRHLEGKADGPTIEGLFADRAKLSAWGRVFLYRVLNSQSKYKVRARQLLTEFGNGLQVEADFAYFDLKELSYDRDIPFFSSRYVTAMLLQAVLEGEGGHPLAPRIMNWLLKAASYEWNTTQTNFWILYAMNEYARTIEKETAQKAEIRVLDDRVEKAFADARDELETDLDITARKSEFPVSVKADRMIYLTTELRYAVSGAGEKSRGIRVERHVYDKAGKEARRLSQGKLYQVEILLNCDKEVPFVVIDEPLAAGFEQIRTEFATAREEKEFNTDHEKDYDSAWLREEHSADRVVFYSYWLPQKTRIVYLIKALYEGEFTWLPTVASGMYHPQYFGRGETRRISVEK
jgi:uncharacterized protein YfaS (alpha-2-macroglobulin family)